MSNDTNSDNEQNGDHGVDPAENTEQETPPALDTKPNWRLKNMKKALEAKAQKKAEYKRLKAEEEERLRLEEEIEIDLSLSDSSEDSEPEPPPSPKKKPKRKPKPMPKRKTKRKPVYTSSDDSAEDSDDTSEEETPRRRGRGKVYQSPPHRDTPMSQRDMLIAQMNNLMFG